MSLLNELTKMRVFTQLVTLTALDIHFAEAFSDPALTSALPEETSVNERAFQQDQDHAVTSTPSQESTGCMLS